MGVVGWLVGVGGWCVGWLVRCWLVRRLVGGVAWLAFRFVGWWAFLVGECVGWLAGWLVGWLVLACWLFGWCVGWLVGVGRLRPDLNPTEGKHDQASRGVNP